MERLRGTGEPLGADRVLEPLRRSADRGERRSHPCPLRVLPQLRAAHIARLSNTERVRCRPRGCLVRSAKGIEPDLSPYRFLNLSQSRYVFVSCITYKKLEESTKCRLKNALQCLAILALSLTTSGCTSLQNCQYGGTYGVDDELGAYVTGSATCPINGSSMGGGTVTCTGTYSLDSGTFVGDCM